MPFMEAAGAEGSSWAKGLLVLSSLPREAEACDLMPSALRHQGCGIPALVSILLVRASGSPTTLV